MPPPPNKVRVQKKIFFARRPVFRENVGTGLRVGRTGPGLIASIKLMEPLRRRPHNIIYKLSTDYIWEAQVMDSQTRCPQGSTAGRCEACSRVQSTNLG